MTIPITLDSLRDRIAEALAGSVKSYNIPAVCVDLGIQNSIGEHDATEAHGSKRIYVKNRLFTKDEIELGQIADRVLKEYPSDELADTLSEMRLATEHRIGGLVRRDVLKALNPLNPLFGDLDIFQSLAEIFGSTVILDDVMGFRGRDSLQSKITQHFIRNDDWSNEELLINCGAMKCSQRRFVTLIEKVMHPMTRSADEQLNLAEAINLALKRDGYTVKHTGTESGYAIYGVSRSQQGVSGAMKNLIFASIGEKPQLIFRDAVNNDVEIVKNADKVLIFDKPLPSSGLLLWSDLQTWWMKTYLLEDPEKAKSQLFNRLKESVCSTRSAGEYAIFNTYYQRYGRQLGDRLPALVPQVYLHYDPYTKRERGDEKFLERQRMDFLLMLENGERIVIEVDGRQHYAIPDQSNPEKYIANSARYADMVAEDRRLKLSGYEVYRFGGHEFHDVDINTWTVGDHAKKVVGSFFDRLLTKHHVL